MSTGQDEDEIERLEMAERQPERESCQGVRHVRTERSSGYEG